MLRILISGFFDGAAVERRELTEPSRWELHSADRVQIEIGISNSSTSPSCPSLSSSTPSSSPVLSIDLLQLPRCLSSSKVGVGAVLWDGGIVLTAVLASLPPSALLGEVVVELGAGVGAPSLAAARRGARVVSTDKGAAVSGVLQKNVELNGLLSPSFKLPPEPGKVALRVLEFGTREGDEAAAALADAVFSSSESFSSSTSVAAATATAGRAVDLVLAADCVYSDGDGESPDPEALCRAAARLLARGQRRQGGGGRGAEKKEEKEKANLLHPSPRFWLASEERDAGTHALFLEAAAGHFATVRRLQLPAELLKGRRREQGRKKKSGLEEEEEEEKDSESENGNGNPWSHVRVFELAGAGCGSQSGLSMSAAEMRALRKPRKRGWP
jgi:predicted nicotinamide N-methyase